MAASPRSAALSGPAQITEYDIKAAFLVHFARYTTWPAKSFPSKKSPIVIGVVGKDPFGKTLDATMKGKTVGARSIQIKRYAKPKDVAAPHILFLGKLKDKERDALLKRLAKQPILIIADESGVAGKGATAGFFLEKSKVRFEVSPKAAKAAGLGISSQLLKLAKLVKTP